MTKDVPDVTVKDWQSVFLSKYRDLLDYFGKKLSMARFTGFSEKPFFFKKSEIWAKSMDSDAIVLNFSKELDITDCMCFMRVLKRLDF